MPQATYYDGDVIITLPHTPGSAVTAGDVVVVGDVTGIAHVDIPANQLGALSMVGGTYIVTGDAAISAGKKVYWNDSANKVTETASGNKAIGTTLTACSADGSTCRIMHGLY